MERANLIVRNYLIVLWLYSAFLPLDDCLLGDVHLPQEMASE